VESNLPAVLFLPVACSLRAALCLPAEFRLEAGISAEAAEFSNDSAEDLLHR